MEKARQPELHRALKSSWRPAEPVWVGCGRHTHRGIQSDEAVVWRLTMSLLGLRSSQVHSAGCRGGSQSNRVLAEGADRITTAPPLAALPVWSSGPPPLSD